MTISIRHDVYFHGSPESPTTARTIALILERQTEIMSTQVEVLAILTDVKTKLTEASVELIAKIDELTAALATAGQSTPEVDAILADVQGIATALADVVPNA